MPETNQAEKKYCRNCKHSMQLQALYCEYCGQKYTTGKITFGALLSEFFQEVFSLDSKIFRTIAALFVPGKLTKEYFAGRHKRYAHPIRLFFITAVVFFSLLSMVVFQIGDEQPGVANLGNELLESAYNAKFMEELDAATDTVIGRLPQSPVVVNTLDTLRTFLKDPQRQNRYLGYIYLTEDWNIKDTSIIIDYRDLVLLPRDSFFAKHQIKGLVSQTLVKQNIRLQTNPKDFARYLMGQMIWMVLLMMPFLALILKLLYIRRRRYYIEHLIFSFHYHAFGFALFSLPLLFTALPLEVTPQLATMRVGAFSTAGVALAAYLYLSMRRVYQQGWLKTFFKFSALNFLYLFVLVLMVALVSIVSLILY